MCCTPCQLESELAITCQAQPYTRMSLVAQRDFSVLATIREEAGLHVCRLSACDSALFSAELPNIILIYPPPTQGASSQAAATIKVPAQQPPPPDGNDAEAISAALKHVHDSLLRLLGYPERDRDGSTVALTRLFSSELRGRTHLVVLDGVWSNDLLEQLIRQQPHNMRGVVLVTARPSDTFGRPICISARATTLTLSSADGEPYAAEQQQAAGQLIGKILGNTASNHEVRCLLCALGPQPLCSCEESFLGVDNAQHGSRVLCC